jgi:hypothetical protein
VRRTISGYVFRPIKVQALGQVEQVPVHLLGNVLAYKKAPSLLRFRWSFAAPLHVVLLSCAAIVSGCATGPTATIPVPVSCLKSEPPAMPQTATEAEILAMNEYAATLIVAATHAANRQDAHRQARGRGAGWWFMLPISTCRQ